LNAIGMATDTALKTDWSVLRRDQKPLRRFLYVMRWVSDVVITDRSYLKIAITDNSAAFRIEN
jgi:hypothetical protein